jgi:hypothetical protein
MEAEKIRKKGAGQYISHAQGNHNCQALLFVVLISVLVTTCACSDFTLIGV